MKLALTEVYEVATFYAHFDVVKEGEVAPPPVTVRVCDSLSCAMRGAEQLLSDLPGKLGREVRVVRAPCMGACDHAPVVAVGHMQVFSATAGQGCLDREGAAASACLRDAERSRALPRRWRLCAARRLPLRQAHPRRPDQDRQRRRPARPRRRRLPDRPQVVAGARRAGAADVRGQLRRRRARHLQGPALPRARSASLHRRHADRRLGGRGARHLHLCARRISRGAAAAGARIREGRSRPGSPSTRGCICAAAPAPTSAAKNPR